MKKVFCVTAFLLVFCSFSLFSEDNLPGFFLSLREAVYEQNLTSREIIPIYNEAKKQAGLSFRGKDLYLILSRCEYMMGRAYQYEEQKDKAGSHYDAGIEQAQKSLDISPSDAAWQMLAENISQNCAVKSTAYAIANGLKVQTYSENALKLNPNNAACQYMVAARWVFAPAPFHNYKRGIQMMEDIINNNNDGMQKDDRFNVHSAIGYAYFQQKKYKEAKPWLEKSLDVYPTNKFVRSMLNEVG
ncbi:MAG: tetratricopeptide repeat protein [Treponema sp.]|jgi:tetratricopeptide (TPR) repeat protein|nr:tetratricopeptide repeat protein [Treponema sp.]